MNKLNAGNPMSGIVPRRYYSSLNPRGRKIENIRNSRTWVEFYPQNIWKDCTMRNLAVTEWNGSSSKDNLKNRVTNLAKIKERPEWYGVKDGAELDKLLKVGDISEKVKLDPKFGNSITNLSIPQKKRRRKWINEEDGDLMPENYIARDPQLFYAKRRVEGKKHRTNLVITSGGNCNIDAKTIQIRAKIYAKIIDELQRQGHNVGVHCMDPIGSHEYENMHLILWEVKRHDEQMTIPQLTRDLGHPGVYRTAIFDIIAAQPRNPGSGLGYTAYSMFDKKYYLEDGSTYANALKDAIKAIKIEIGEPTIILNLLSLEKNLNEKDLDKTLKKLKNQISKLITQPKFSGVHLINHNDHDSEEET
tara:strand:+ start:458 stop:1540 length:1083 start_codon:yes stop_codon:yes gene_type:complete